MTTSTHKTKRQPVIYVPHGGGPWPFVDMGGMVPKRDIDVLKKYLEDLPKHLPEKPKALLVISAHWEEKVPTVMTSPHPPMFYDYYGFPPDSYTIQWPAPGDAALAERVEELLGQAGFETQEDPTRGFDHGTFVPFKLSWPNADIPTVQLSLIHDLDPAQHIALGKALAPLRDEGVLILGSGMSYHNLREYFKGTGKEVSEKFDAWLKEAVTADPKTREKELTQWAQAPAARQAHPREEHLLPLMVAAGAAGNDQGRITFNDYFMGTKISAVEFKS